MESRKHKALSYLRTEPAQLPRGNSNSYGSFKWLVILEGLTNSPASFQQFMNDVFSDMIDVSVIVYLDDILIYSNNPTGHRKHVKEVLQHLCKHGLFTRTNQCEFHSERVEYLGYILFP